MATWSIAPLHIEDLDEFVQCQFLAFVGNPLHDVVYPTQPASAEKHRKAINEGSKLQADNEIIYLKAVDIRSGNIVGGIKCCYYVGEDVLTSSPYAAGITDVEAKATDNDQYCCYVVNEFLGKRASDIKGQHARKFIAKDRKHGWIIDILFVHPEYSRRGIGRELVARTCSMADRRGLKAIVEASPAGKRTYELCGYQSKEVVTIPPKQWTDKPVQLYYWMEREPLRQVRR
ncbi:hypothetical protein LTR09_012886 [Extremus antarcticus]|uniref:N-acetyltransferase domain-containing protein n=1 Tax=Extremus antarcticus TaxID=702011 RepID=A0AAJ0G8W9_9PEZI|nr:hypothetical protein LTR09_012886 [Extremus antarcticus]